MKKSINLLIRRYSYEYREKVFSRIRIAIVVIGFLCVLSLVMIYSLKTNVNIQKQKLLSKKEEYLSELLTKKDIEKKVSLLDEKSTTLVNILNNDVDFLEYYHFLQSHLPLSTGSAQLSQMQFDNKRKVSFTLNFSRFNDFYQTLQDFEKDQFLDNFDSVSLGSFVVSPEVSNESFKIVFNGSLKNIKNEKTN